MDEEMTQTTPIPGSERSVLVIDNKLFFVRNGWFFDKVFYSDKGDEFRPYLDFVSEQKPDWKSYSVYNEYYMDGKWNHRTAACGEVRL